MSDTNAPYHQLDRVTGLATYEHGIALALCSAAALIVLPEARTTAKFQVKATMSKRSFTSTLEHDRLMSWCAGTWRQATRLRSLMQHQARRRLGLQEIGQKCRSSRLTAVRCASLG